MKVAEILRVSTKEQSEDDRAGLPRQKAVNIQTVKKYDLTLIKTFEIIDVSGTSVIHTPEIKALIKMMKSGLIDGVVVADWDRLLRLDNFSDLSLLQHFIETKTLIYTPDNVVDLNTQSGFLFGGMQSIIAGNDLTQIKKRMLAAKEVKRINGEHPNCDITLPTGVSYNRKEKRFYYNENSSKIKLLFNMFCHEGILNYCELERQTGLKNRTIPNLLKNELFIGYRLYDTKRSTEKIIGQDGRQTDRPKVKRNPDEIIRVKVIDNPLIDEATFQKAQKIIKSKNRRYHAKRSKEGERFLYSGILKCGCCGDIMYSTSGGRNHLKDYYLCSSKNYQRKRKNGKSECNTKYLPRKTVDHSVTKFVAEKLTDEGYLKSVINTALSSERIQEQKTEAEMLEGMLTRIKAKRSKLADLYIDGRIDKDDLDKKLNGLDGEESSLKYRLDKIQNAKKLEPNLVLEAISPIIKTLVEFPFWTPIQKRTFMKSQLPEITVTNHGINGLRVGVPTLRNHRGMDSWQPRT